MLIMLEGLDRTGKTTLANAIAKRLGAPVIHKSAPTGDWFIEYVAPLAGYQPGLDLVLDRWHWGEMVWPTVFGRDVSMPLSGFRYVDAMMTKLGGVAVLGTGDLDAVWQDAVAADEPIAKLPNGQRQFANAHRLFNRVAGISTLPVFEYDYRSMSLADAVASVTAMARDAQRTAVFNAAAEAERLMEVRVG